MVETACDGLNTLGLCVTTEATVNLPYIAYLMFDNYLLKYIFAFLSVAEVRFIITLVSKCFKDLRSPSYDDIQTIVEHAAETGSLSTLQWLQTTYETFDIYSNIVCSHAAKQGHMHVIEWAHTNDYDWDITVVCRHAAEGGHISILKYVAQSYTQSFSSIFAILCEKGHLDIIKWLEEEIQHRGSVSDYAYAARNGHVLVLAYGVERHNKDIAQLCELAYQHASSTGHIETLKFLCDSFGYRVLGTHTCMLAARSGKLEALRWARESGYEWDEHTCLEAAYSGHFEMLKWAIANGCEYNVVVCAEAAAMWGNIEMLKWAREAGYEYGSNSRVPRLAFMHGHVHLLNFAIEDGCTITEDILAECANICTKLASFVWAKEKGFKLPVTFEKFSDLAALKWVRSHGLEITDTLCRAAAAAGQLSILQWAKDEGYVFDKSISLYAVDTGVDNVHILRWARNNGLLHEDVFAVALMNNRLGVLKWLKKSRCGVWNKKCEEVIYMNDDARRWAKSNGYSSTLHINADKFFYDLSRYELMGSM